MMRTDLRSDLVRKTDQICSEPFRVKIEEFDEKKQANISDS